MPSFGYELNLAQHVLATVSRYEKRDLVDSFGKLGNAQLELARAFGTDGIVFIKLFEISPMNVLPV